MEEQLSVSPELASSGSCTCEIHGCALCESEPTLPRMGVARAIWHVVSSVALTLVVALAVAVYVIPRALGGAALTIDSGSMAPALETGDMVAVRDIDPSAVKLGDIITYSTKNALITHRVIGVGAQGGQTTFITQGDANNTADSPILAEQLRGKVIYSLPKLGTATAWLQSNLHLVIFGAAAIWLGSYLLEIISLRRARC